MKNNLSLGTDIEEISRFSQLNKKDHKNFFEKVYTKKEQAYCFSKSNPSQHLAARFAGKEAAIKVLSGLKVLKKSTLPKDIEILNDKRNAPQIYLNKKTYPHIELTISLSHSRKNAMAFAAGIKNE